VILTRRPTDITANRRPPPARRNLPRLPAKYAGRSGESSARSGPAPAPETAPRPSPTAARTSQHRAPAARQKCRSARNAASASQRPRDQACPAPSATTPARSRKRLVQSARRHSNADAAGASVPIVQATPAWTARPAVPESKRPTRRHTSASQGAANPAWPWRGRKSSATKSAPKRGRPQQPDRWRRKAATPACRILRSTRQIGQKPANDECCGKDRRCASAPAQNASWPRKSAALSRPQRPGGPRLPATPPPAARESRHPSGQAGSRQP
jgi:hypothetical protein